MFAIETEMQNNINMLLQNFIEHTCTNPKKATRIIILFLGTLKHLLKGQKNRKN